MYCHEGEDVSLAARQRPPPSSCTEEVCPFSNQTAAGNPDPRSMPAFAHVKLKRKYTMDTSASFSNHATSLVGEVFLISMDKEEDDLSSDADDDEGVSLPPL